MNFFYLLASIFFTIAAYRMAPDLNGILVDMMKLGAIVTIFFVFLTLWFTYKTIKGAHNLFKKWAPKFKILTILLLVIFALTAYVWASSKQNTHIISGILSHIDYNRLYPIPLSTANQTNGSNSSLIGSNLNIKKIVFPNATKVSNVTKTSNFSINNNRNQTSQVNTTKQVTYKELKTQPKTIMLTYTFHGITQKTPFVVYKGVYDYLSEIPRSISYIPGIEPAPTMKDFVMKEINNKVQNEAVYPLVKKIKILGDNPDDQVRIAVSMIQHIPYDCAEAMNKTSQESRYPYQVLYDMKGICGEKSELLAMILRDLGYGVALFYFEDEDHMAVGIKCPKKYSYRKSGFCFIESTNPTIITDANETYNGVGKLSSTPIIIKVCNGTSFNSVYKEYNDAQEWIKLNKESEENGGYLTPGEYYEWLEISKKYDLTDNKKCPTYYPGPT